MSPLLFWAMFFLIIAYVVRANKIRFGSNLEKIVYQIIFAETSSTRSEISPKKLPRKISAGNVSIALQSWDTFDDVIAKKQKN